MAFTIFASIGAVAAVLQALGYAIYIKHFLNHRIRPNAASFFMFAYGTSLLALLEWQSGAGWQLLLLPGVCASLSVIVALMCVPRGATDPIDRVEAIAFSTDLWLTVGYVALLYWNSHPSGFASWFLIATNLTAVTCFLPVVRSTWNAPERELPGPWVVWTLAYAALTAATVQADGGRHLSLLIYPLLNMLLHGSVAILALRVSTADRDYVDAAMSLYIAPSGIHGRGVYAGHSFATGQVIWTLTGSPIFKSHSNAGPNLVGISPHVWIDPDRPIDTMNHSCAPNAAFGRNLQLVALRIIEPDEEVTFDYSTTEADPDWLMHCGCAVEECRVELRAIQIAFGNSHFPPAASPVMQRVWRSQRQAAQDRSAFPQLALAADGSLPVAQHMLHEVLAFPEKKPD
jgi:hypothetical protein